MTKRSQHLRVLRDAGLVVDWRAGNGRAHRLQPDGVGALGPHLDRFWSRALAAYKAAVEQPTKEVA
jgi:hypothetical protein